ncbi:hypothetical protein FKP32DRAFT_1672524 [Trametes sanguinea]|nr:hypothetical protein FKP32DRAFT_1672524 [Trametes sanguinea]
MRLDTIGVTYAARYVNAQLACLHENATKFREQNPQEVIDDNQRLYALADFTIPQGNTPARRAEPLFHARFKAPKLNFVCGHDALLTLTFEEGEFLANSARGHEGDRMKIQANSTAEFRVAFEAREAGSNLHIDGYIPMIKVVILNLKSARMESLTPTECQDALLRYLTEYLNVLHEAGNDVLYLLPQFSAEAKLAIDFTPRDQSSKDCKWQKSICGITVEECNSHLASLWLNAAMLLRSGIVVKDADRRLCSLAEFVMEDAEISYRIRFGPPHVHILCAREVVVYLNIDELEFFRGPSVSASSARKYTSWRVAFLVGVLQERDSGGQVVAISLDCPNARYVHGLSDYGGIQVTGTTTNDVHHRDLIIDFLSTKYFDILRSVNHHTVYSRNNRSEAIWRILQESTAEAEEPTVLAASGPYPDDVSYHDTVHHAKMYEFDQVIAISQHSLNVQLSTLSHALLRSWSYGEAFSASFNSGSVRLLSGNRAIIWVNLASGKMKTLRDGRPSTDPTSPSHEFKNWLVAFEVGMKLCTQAELERHSSSACHDTIAYKKHGNKPDRHLEHICLDLSSARYIHDHSYYQDLNASCNVEDGRSRLLKIDAVVWYLTQHYFPAVAKHGFNVLSSIPVFKAGPSLPSYALTSVSFQVYSKDEVTRSNWMQVSAGSEPILVILGMTGSRPLPPTRLQYSTNWIAQPPRGVSHGTICISYEAFKQRLLDLLAKVNAQTSFIPIADNEALDFFGSLTLRAWENSDRHKRLSAAFQPPDSAHPREYHFEHTEKRVMSFGGDVEIDADQKIFCTTENFAELPTTLERGELNIKIHGTTKLSFSVTAESADQLKDLKEIFRASASANWSNKISIETIEGGVKVNTADSSDPKVIESKMVGKKLGDPKDLLSKAFPPKIHLDDVLAEIRAFEGTWDYCYPPAAPYSLARPTFNADGDLVFELRVPRAGHHLGEHRGISHRAYVSHRHAHGGGSGDATFSEWHVVHPVHPGA